MGIVVALAVIGFIALLVFGYLAEQKRRKAWAEIGARLGLTVTGKKHLVGELDGSSVEADMYSIGSGKNRRTYTRVQASGDLPGAIDLGKEGFFSSFTEDHRTGDLGFDAAVRVKGDAAVALAILDEAMRATVRTAVAKGWVFKGRAWVYQVQRTLGAEIEPLLREGAALAAEMRSAAQELAPRLVARVRSDPNVEARRRGLELLIAKFQGTPELPLAVRAALTDEDAEVRLLAACEAGAIEVLGALAGTVEVAPELRAKALREACRTSDRPEVADVVDALVDAQARDQLGVVMQRALADALVLVPNARAEATLMSLLATKDDEVELTAIKSLGQVGSIAAVPLLIPIRDRFMAFARESSGAAKEAIMRIQARRGHAEAGSLALAEVESGLSVIEPEEQASERALVESHEV